MTSNQSTRMVGPAEIADMFDVHPVTVDRWRRDGILPAPGQWLRRGPIWSYQTIVEWAESTGREISE
jgi:hypothetical protein